LVSLPAVARFSPVIEKPITIDGDGSTTLYGLDLLPAHETGGDAEQNVFRPEDLEKLAVVSSDLAARLNWKRGDSIQLKGPDRTQEFVVQSIAANQQTEWIGIDIAAAQQLLNTYGKVDRIDVFLPAG